MSHTMRSILGGCVLALSVPVVAQNAARDGIEAFNQGDYETALALFLEAEDDGEASQSLQYNIAVSLYRLGQYDAARERFLTLVGDPEWEPLVSYNLGLVAEATGDRDSAQRYYTVAAGPDGEERLRGAAQRKLDSLDGPAAGDGAAPAATGPTLAGLVSVKAGLDSNASSLADELLDNRSRTEDVYHEELAYGHWQATGRYRDGMRLYGLVYNRGFRDFDHLDSQVVSLGAVFEKPLGEYRTETGLRINATRLDDGRVAEQFQWHAGIGRQLPIGLVEATYALSRFEAAQAYKQIAGEQQRLDLEWRRSIAGLVLAARYRFEYNNRENLERNGAYASYSPHRHGIRLDAERSFGEQWTAGLRLEHLYSRYDGVNRLRDTNGEVVEQPRRNRRNRLTLDGEYRLDGNWRFTTEYQYTDQRDNYALYTYDKHRLSVGAEYRF